MSPPPYAVLTSYHDSALSLDQVTNLPQSSHFPVPSLIPTRAIQTLYLLETPSNTTLVDPIQANPSQSNTIPLQIPHRRQPPLSLPSPRHPPLALI